MKKRQLQIDFNLNGFLMKEWGHTDYVVLSVFQVLYAGWEMDNLAILIESREQAFVVGTSHGQPCWMTKKTLKELANSYAEALTSTETALRMMT